METLRLLAIIEPARVLAGPAKNVLDFARLARDGRFGLVVETTVAEFRNPGDPAVFLDAGRAAGIPVVDISRWNRWDRKAASELVSLVQDLKPDIVQTNALLSHFVARFAGLPHLLPWVAFHHGYTWPNLRTQVYNQADRWSLRAATRVVTVCNAFRDQLRHRGIPEQRIEVIPNAIDSYWGASVRDGAAGLRTRLAISPGKKIILSVGRLSREKGHVTLVEAVARLHRGGLEAHLLIVGDGPERRRIEVRARALGVSAHLTMAGVVPAEPYYGVADVFALPSLSEGSPNCLLESMVTAVPLVATSVGGVPEMVSHRETGLLVPPRDSTALAGALLELLRNPLLARSLSAKGAILVQSRFSLDARMRQLVSLYHSVLNDRGQKLRARLT
jgi:glycosyltransferase involved in cell wall biosynthesis